ncbi:MAG: BTAD domain-containing putative transcriptional regulator [Chloroflexota bacterium]
MPGLTHHLLIAHSKLAAPRLHRHTLLRPRIEARLREAADYRLTLIQAGAGFGKSTALTAFAADTPNPTVWYHLDEDDADPLRFLLHLWHGFNRVLEGFSTTPLAMLEEIADNPHSISSDPAGAPSDAEQAVHWYTVVDALNNALLESSNNAIFLIFDDVHVLDVAPVTLRVLDRFIGRAPDQLRFLLAGRYPLRLPNLVGWRVRNDVLEIGQAELAFNSDEIAALFRNQYNVALSDDQVDLLANRLEGWVMPMPLVWQHLRSRPQEDLSNTQTVSRTLARLSGSGSDLFMYLAQEVIDQQPSDVAEFLRQTSVLRQMTADACDALRQTDNSREILRYLRESGLFVVDLGDGTVRYHHLFHELLRHQLASDQAMTMHERAARYYETEGYEDEAIAHWLAAGELGLAKGYEAAARLLDHFGRNRVRIGQLDALAVWLSSLPPDVLYDHPSLLVYMGDIARLQSRFSEALGWYEQAESRSRAQGDVPGLGQALRGQARVYLDTVNPSQAERLLQAALRLSDGEEDMDGRARLMELLAENLINRGHAEEARRYQVQAQELRDSGPDSADLSARLLLRTGRLAEGHRLLEERVVAERDNPVMRPRAHRETFLLLALVLAMEGDQAGATGYAKAGTDRGMALQSPFVTAVGYMRQGHAWLLQHEAKAYAAAEQCFHEAIAISERLSVPRLRVEANWGLCHVYGFQGEMDRAADAAATGMELARAAGDEWVEAIIRLAMGASLTMAHEETGALDWLAQANVAFRNCGDTHGEAAVRLWQCLVWQQLDDEARLQRDLADLLRLVRQHGYDHLFKQETLLGPPDARVLIPLLLYAREQGHGQPWGQTADRLLAGLGLDGLQLHPGFQLRVQALGTFRLWRGLEEVPTSAWKRRSARQLFQLLLANRRKMLEREQLCELLWPELGPAEAERDFKVAYSTLCNVLEPGRGRNTPSSFILRDGTRYGIRPEADLWLDAVKFETAVLAGDARREHETTAMLADYRTAFDLYKGDYLQDAPYEEWASAERERLLTLFMRTAERMATLQADDEAWEDVIATCRLILARDDCWEQAYRLMMTAYAHLGNRAQVLRTYRRCVTALRDELE